jgi:hypothetical protein
MLMHPMQLHIAVRTKICLFENEYSLFASRYFHFVASMPEDGLVRPKHVAVKCDFNDILK